EARDVGEADVLEHLLALAHALLVRDREPDELRVGLVDRERMVLPRAAAVLREDARAPVARDPGAVGVERDDGEQVLALGLLRVLLLRPGPPAVLGAQDQAELTDGPAGLLFRHRDVV